MKRASIEVEPETWKRYVEAHEEIERILGQSPGPEFLMSLVVEQENPLDLVLMYVNTAIQHVQRSGRPETSSSDPSVQAAA